MSAALAVIMMLGTMIGMGASEASKQAQKDLAQNDEIEIVDETASTDSVTVKEVDAILDAPAPKAVVRTPTALPKKVEVQKRPVVRKAKRVVRGRS